MRNMKHLLSLTCLFALSLAPAAGLAAVSSLLAEDGLAEDPAAGYDKSTNRTCMTRSEQVANQGRVQRGEAAVTPFASPISYRAPARCRDASTAFQELASSWLPLRTKVGVPPISSCVP